MPIDDRELPDVHFALQERPRRLATRNDRELMPDRGSARPQRSTKLMRRAWLYYLASAIPLAVIYLWLPVDSAKLFVWPVIG